MNISKKKEPVKQVQQKVMNLSLAQKKLYITRWDCILEFGKFKGRNAQYVYDNERWWWDWAEDNELLYQWNIKVLAEDAMRPQIRKPVGFWSETYKAYWIGLREIE